LDIIANLEYTEIKGAIMADLSSTFMGLHLANPIILGSSGLSTTKDGVARAIKAGVGAIVLKSLFEEQLRAELKQANLDTDAHPEAAAFIEGQGMTEGTSEYLAHIKAAKAAANAAGTKAPVIASINGTGDPFWLEFASMVEGAGADALELNLGIVPSNPDLSASEIEEGLINLVSKVAKTVKIPVCAKLGASYTNIGNVAKRMAKAGIKGLTLFNRFYRMDIDLDNMSLASGPTRSSPEAYHESLRWISLLEGRVGADICSSGGVYDGLAALRLVAAGASAVQLCSAVYTKGFGVISSTIQEMNSWMDEHGVAKLGDIRGRLARRNSDKPELYGRLHYVKALTGQG